VKGLIGSFFNNSYKQFASFFTSRKELSVDELKEIRKMIDDEIKKKEK
jgi:hypothetical protein